MFTAPYTVSMDIWLSNTEPIYYKRAPARFPFKETDMKTFQHFLAEAAPKWEHISPNEGSQSRGEIRPGLKAEDYNGVYAHIHHGGHHYVIAGSADGKHHLHKDGAHVQGDEDHGMTHHELHAAIKAHGLPKYTGKLSD